MAVGRACIVDYGVGNLQSIRNAVRLSAGVELDLVSSPELLREYDKIILPGVGSFGDAMSTLHQRGLDDALRESYGRGTLLMGICLGMQLLAERGFEHGDHAGLGIVPGVVKKLEGKDIRTIHMGWNDIVIERSDPLLDGISSGADFYFVHGYCLYTEHTDTVLASCEYGVRFPAIVRSGNAWGAQFHPEKSQQQGVQILKNFVEMKPC